METEASPAMRGSPPLWLRLVLGRNPAWTVARILLVVAVVAVLFRFVLLPIRVTGNSMFPTYKDGQIKFVNRLAYVSRDPARGDIVAVEYHGQEILLLKRIVAMPGEMFHVYAGDIYIDGEKLGEPYAYGKITAPPPEKGVGNLLPMQLGRDEYIVIGDNRPESDLWARRRRSILGKVL